MMRVIYTRRSGFVAIGLLAAIGVTAGQALAGGGGLSVSPGILEHVAGAGGVGSVRVSNTTSGTMAVTLAARPWAQAANGEVSPNRGRTLSEVQFATPSFTLPAGSSRTVAVTLSRTPSGRSAYGGLEAIGVPGRKGPSTINVDYRVISSLRLDPPSAAQRFGVQTGALLEQGTTTRGTLLLAVRNTGNTIVPIGGKVSISGQGRSLSSNAVAKAIVPGATVDLPLAQLLGALSRGRYAVSVRLSQGGRSVGTVRRTVNLR